MAPDRRPRSFARCALVFPLILVTMGFAGGKTGPRFAPVILAGGSGTRFWPRSRRARAKQVLALDGARTTAPACGLAAFLLELTAPETVIGIFPSDHIVKNQARFAEVIRAGVALAAGGDRIVVLGVPPTRAETGYGYVELGEVIDAAGDVPVRRVKRFTEKPDRARAEQFVASGNYAWNGGIFLWSARTLANAMREHCPAMAPLLERIAAAHGTPDFERVFAELYPQCQNISIDYAVLEPRSAKGELKSEIYCLPADFAWNDIGSWAALHEELTGGEMCNFFDATDPVSSTIDAEGNYVYAPGKVVALVGVNDLVVVDTGDCLLITTRERSQDVGKVVTDLKRAERDGLV